MSRPVPRKNSDKGTVDSPPLQAIPKLRHRGHMRRMLRAAPAPLSAFLRALLLNRTVQHMRFGTAVIATSKDTSWVEPFYETLKTTRQSLFVDHSEEHEWSLESNHEFQFVGRFMKDWHC